MTIGLYMCGLCCAQDNEELDIRDAQPYFDNAGRFWVYKDGKTLRGDNIKPVPPYGLPFLPYAFMPKQASSMLDMTLDHTSNPFDGDKCIRVSVTWKDPYWCGVGFFSGLDQGVPGNEPPGGWWGKKNYGWYYDLRQLEKKKLVFHLRGEHGGEKIQWKVGSLATNTYGDSLRYPVVAKEGTKRNITLYQNWERYEIVLNQLPVNQLERICSMCFIVAQAEQDPDRIDDPVTFYIDNVYFE